jgi:hypothetical protein
MIRHIGRRQPREKPIRTQTGWKTLHINGKEWKYRNGTTIKIISPDGNTYTTNISQATGMSWLVLERAHWKKTGGECKPSHVKKWIEEHLIKNV